MKMPLMYKSLGFPFAVSPSASFIELTSCEEAEASCYVLFVAWYKKENRYERIRIDFHRTIASKMASFGGEVWDSDENIGEILNSEWLNEMYQFQVKNYPNNQNTRNGIRHFYLRGREVYVEILAENYSWVKVSD